MPGVEVLYNNSLDNYINKTKNPSLLVIMSLTGTCTWIRNYSLIKIINLDQVSYVKCVIDHAVELDKSCLDAAIDTDNELIIGIISSKLKELDLVESIDKEVAKSISNGNLPSEWLLKNASNKILLHNYYILEEEGKLDKNQWLVDHLKSRGLSDIMKRVVNEYDDEDPEEWT